MQNEIDPKTIEELGRLFSQMLDDAQSPNNYELLSGKPAKNFQSKAAFDGVKLDKVVGSGEIKAPVYGKQYAKFPQARVVDVADELMKVRIQEAIQRVGSLDLPTNLPDLPKPPKPQMVPKSKIPLAGLLSPFSVALELLLHSPELNAGEDERLKQYKQDDMKSSGGPR